VKTTSVWASLFFLVACGGEPGSTLDVERASGAQFRLEGDCGPSARSTALPVRLSSTRCLVATQPPTLVETAEDLRRLVTPGCTEGLEVDFATSKVLVVSARGASEWFTFINFVQARADALEVGLVIRPQGALPPDTLVVLDRAAPPLELRWCRSVCIANCDQALP